MLHYIGPHFMVCFVILVLAFINIQINGVHVSDKSPYSDISHHKITNSDYQDNTTSLMFTSQHIKIFNGLFAAMKNTFTFAMKWIEKVLPTDAKLLKVDFKSRLPGALIIGVKKGGTRALLEFLKLHPNIEAAGPEVHFFDKSYHKGLQWYRSRMPKSYSDQITMEKTPAYFIDPLVPKRVHAMNSNMKIILVVRDPVQRALSDYAQAVERLTHKQTLPVSTSPNHIRSFEETVFITDNKPINDQQMLPNVNTANTLIKTGLYIRYYADWLQYFNASQILVVSGEELIKNPSRVVNSTLSFLNLPLLISGDSFYFNATKGFPCISKQEEIGKMYHCFGSNKGRKHPYVEPYLLKRLYAFFQPFNQLFYNATGIDYQWLL